MVGGVLGGLAGAVAFGAITGATTVSRWLVVVIVGGALGGLFSVLLGRWASHSVFASIGLGVLWGAAWWLPGLLFYPWHSIGGFVAWGAIVGAVFDFTRRIAGHSVEGPMDVTSPGSATLDPSKQLPPPERRV